MLTNAAGSIPVYYTFLKVPEHSLAPGCNTEHRFAYHRIENLTSSKPDEVYDVVGPVCESSDVFCRDRKIPATERGDMLVMRTAGAYGEAMAFGYNCRALPKAVLSTDIL